MKKLEKRAIICLTLAALLFIGICFFIGKLVMNGGDWATFYANDHIYTEGKLDVGTIYDVNGKLLAENHKGEAEYNDDYSIRCATVHTVGDLAGNIAASAESAFRSKLVGYNLLTGTYSIGGEGKKLYLTLDADVCKTAYNALGGRNGVVAAYNYQTGEIICLVSSPGFDPENPPSLSADDTSGIYINKFFDATLVPGSIFKLVTTAAVIDKKRDADNWTYKCDGTNDVNGEKITCTSAHGTVDLYGALSNSCNCAYAQLTLEIGADAMKEYVEKLGLTKSYNVNGIETAVGSFQFPSEANINLGWSGIGQYEDQVNPCSMLAYMGAIANGGTAASPKIIHTTLGGKTRLTPESKVYSMLGLKKSTGELLSAETASQLADMMKNNVKTNYGEGNYPGLDIYAKSGTAEVGAWRAPNAWFVGFIKNPDYPYAFLVCVENGGTGSYVAGPIANSVLQEIVD